jgi:hypothetical protein
VSSFLVVTKAQARAIRRALRQQDSLPARGVTVGPVKWEPPDAVELDEQGDPLPTPGWTTETVDAGDMDGDTVAIEVPQRFERFAGKTVRGVTLPALTAEADLPAGIKTLRAAKLNIGVTP